MGRSDVAQQLRAYRITTTVYAFAAAVAAWLVATRTTVSILDLLLFGFAMVVPPAVALGYLIYYRRTTEQGVFWGMMTGYAGGLIWFGLLTPHAPMRPTAELLRRQFREPAFHQVEPASTGVRPLRAGGVVSPTAGARLLFHRERRGP